MVFNAIVYYIHNIVIMKLLESDVSPPMLNKVYHPNSPFFISRLSVFELSPNHLFLPGSSDYRDGFPRVLSIKLNNPDAAISWICDYKAAYQDVNGCEAVTINLDEPMFETEETPEVKLA